MGIETRIDRQQRAHERRKGQRRAALAPYSGPERRRHERRAIVDFGTID